MLYCYQQQSVQFSSVAQSRPTLYDPMDSSRPGLPVHHQFPEFTQTHVHQVGDVIQPSHPLLNPSPPALNLSQHQSLFQWVSSSHQVAEVLESGHLMRRTDSLEKILILGKTEGGRRRGWQRMRWLNGITDSVDMNLSNSRSWWWTGKPGVLQFFRLQRVGHDWATELNWTESLSNIFLWKTLRRADQVPDGMGACIFKKKKMSTNQNKCNLKNDRIISVRFQGKPFNITVI